MVEITQRNYVVGESVDKVIDELQKLAGDSNRQEELGISLLHRQTCPWMRDIYLVSDGAVGFGAVSFKYDIHPRSDQVGVTIWTRGAQNSVRLKIEEIFSTELQEI